MSRIRDEIDLMPLMDCHTHLMPPEVCRQGELTLFEFFKHAYVAADFISAGMSVQAWRTPVQSAQEGWRRVVPYLPRVQNTGYFRCLLRALRDLLEFRETSLNEQSWTELSERLAAANKRADWYEYVMKQRAGIEVSILDSLMSGGILDLDRRFFRQAIRMDQFHHGHKKAVLFRPAIQDIFSGDRPWVFGREEVEKRWGAKVGSLDEYLELLDIAFQKCVEAGIVAIKSVRAYDRSLHYEEVSRAEADRIFVKPDDQVTPSEVHAFENFMMHEVIRKTVEYNLPFQIHTGIQAGQGNRLYNANPLLLNDLLLKYREAKFVLFHGGYPWTAELAVLAKNNANVVLDFCWLPQICPQALRQCLCEWIELVPSNKFTWGTDIGHPEQAYGCSRFVREILAEVLEDKVRRGYFDTEIALDIARRILHDNAFEIYTRMGHVEGLPGKIEAVETSRLVAQN